MTHPTPARGWPSSQQGWQDKRVVVTGGAVTITHPAMDRFFVTIPEAMQLVPQAAVLGRGGEVFVLDRGEPVKVVNLATDLVQLSELEVGCDSAIVFTGLRPGEKLSEELFVPGESYGRTRRDKIFTASNCQQLRARQPGRCQRQPGGCRAARPAR